jgi:hypothetical protein
MKLKYSIAALIIAGVALFTFSSFYVAAQKNEVEMGADPVCEIYGKIKIVDYGEDYKVKIVTYGEDLKIKWVDYGEDNKGKWKKVEYGERFKIKWVEYGEDFTIKEVTYGEGC